MNVFRRELRWGLRPALIWAGSLSLTGLLMVALFPAFQKDMEPMMALLRGYPQSVLRALGLDAAALNTFNGYYGFVATYVLLCAVVQALGAGIKSIAKEGARGTTGFLFTRTRSRASILAQKYLAALVSTLLVGLAYGASVYLGARSLVADLDRRMLLMMNGAFLLTQLLCLSLGFCLGCCARRVKAPGGLALGVGSLSFALLLLANLTGEWTLALFSPMGYASAMDVLARGGYDPVRLAALIALSAALTAAGAWRYARKDLV